MGRTRNAIPKYLLHRPSGQARVRIDGRDFYLGKYLSPESRQKYGELVSKISGGGFIDPLSQRGPEDTGPTINELTLAFLTFAAQHYLKNGVETAEVDCIKSAVKPLVAMFGDTPAKSFGPVALKAVRLKMVDDGKMCRTYINKSIGRIRRMFRYAVECELISPTVLVGLEAVAPLLAGRTTAIDHASRTAIPQDRLDAVRNAVTEQTRDMIDLAILTGCRPGELVSLTSGMIDRTSDVWIAALADHKNVHHGKQRILVFGLKSQAILEKYLRSNPSLRLFPIERGTFSNRLKKACDDLKLPRFTGHWLRHTAATEFRDSHGLDAAQTMLGHSSANMTQLYAHLDVRKAVDIARQCG